MDTQPRAVARFRVAWRRNDGGQVGTTAWTRYRFVAEGWLYSLNRHHGDRITHWIETDREPTGSGRRAFGRAIGHAQPDTATAG